MDLRQYFIEAAEKTIRERNKMNEYNTDEAIQKLIKQKEQLTDQYNFEMAILEERIQNITLRNGEE